jgi:hypothetical protein
MTASAWSEGEAGIEIGARIDYYCLNIKRDRRAGMAP